MNRSLRVLHPHIRGQRSVLAVAGLSTALIALAEVAKPFPLKIIIDRLLAPNGAPQPFTLTTGDLLLLAGVAALAVAIAGVEALATYQMELRLRRVGESVAHSLRVALYAHLQRLSLSFHDRSRQGDLVTRATGDVQAVGLLFSESVGALASSSLLLVGMLVVSLLIDPILAMAAFSVAPLLAFLTFVTRNRVKAAARTQRVAEGEIASLATETLSAMRAVKSLGSERLEEERLERISEERRAAGVESARVEGRFAGAVDVLGAVSAAVVLVVGVIRVAVGAVTPGDLVVMVSYARRIHRPLRELARETGRVARGLARAERIAEVLAEDDVLPEPPDAHRGPRARGEVRFESVSFSYDLARPVLADVSFAIPAGGRVALAGPSGAGKSTVAALAARFYDPSSGRITLDGHDLRECSVSWLRSQVGLVLQDTILFTGTVAENIAYGTRANLAAVERASRAAGAHAFVSELPHGYDTMLGPRGVALSGGQRQRIALARTLLRDPPVLVLDEPTAALDQRAEAEVVTGLEALLQGRTTLLITHSPTLLRMADEVLTIDRGRVDVPASPPSPRPDVPASPPSPPPDVPADPALPGMRSVLDPQVMADVLGRSLGNGAHPVGVDIDYLRYKPGTNLVVQYGVRVDGRTHVATGMIAAGANLDRRATRPEHRAMADLVGDRVPARRALSYDAGVGCLIQWYPLDLALPALAEPPERLDPRMIEEPGSREAPTLLAYKPRRRAVLHVGQSVVKCYAANAEFAAACAGLRASQALTGVLVPSLEGDAPAVRATAQSFVAGRIAASPADAASHAGTLLRTLHETDPGTPGLEELPMALSDRQLAAAEASARLVTAIAPEQQSRIERLVANLEASIPLATPLVPSHGDFNARQLVATDDGLVLTDFDELCFAPAALDVATYVAYVVRGDAASTASAPGVLGAMLDGYGGRPPDLGWYLATMILRGAPLPFRYFEPAWRDRVAVMLTSAEVARAW